MQTADEERLEAFFKQLGSATRGLLMLDYDGTLAPFRVERNEARPYEGIPELLNQLMQHGCRVVIITGRSASDLLRLLGTERTPEVWGTHGLERLAPDGRMEHSLLTGEHLKGLRKARDWAEEAGLAGRLEVKYGCLALHWRGLAPAERSRLKRRSGAAWEPVAAGYGLLMRGFDGGVELRAPGRDKGTAVRTLLSEEEQGGEPVAAAYLGDDLTDEDAFRAVKPQGFAVLVRPRRRPTAADVWLKPPGELLRFLQRWLILCRR